MEFIQYQKFLALKHGVASCCVSYPPHGKAFGDVVPNKPNHDGAGNDGEHPCRRQCGPVHAGSADGSGHGGHNRFGIHAGQRACQQQLHPAEHEAEESGHADTGLDEWQKNSDKKAG